MGGTIEADDPDRKRAKRLLGAAFQACLTVTLMGAIIAIAGGYGSPLWMPVVMTYLLAGGAGMVLIDQLARRRCRLKSITEAGEAFFGNTAGILTSIVLFDAFVFAHALLLPEILPMSVLVYVVIGSSIGTAWQIGRRAGMAESARRCE